MKYLPVFLLIGGAVLVSLVGFVIFNLRSKEAPKEKEEVARELPIDEWPYVTLTPNKAGNELALSISRIPGSATIVEYELTYNTAPGVLQGVPGSVDVAGKLTLERKLTLGTCSSGVCRYDKGVKDIKLTLKLREKTGKLITKSTMNVDLLTGTLNLTHSSGKFSLALDKKATGYFVVMETYGLPSGSDKAPGMINAGPFGVFASGNSVQSGTVSLSGGTIYKWDGGLWKEVSGGKTKTLGTFIAVQ